MKTVLFAILLSIGVTTMLNAQTALQTSFEVAEGYNPGNLNGQNGWTVSAGNASIYTTKAYTGAQSANLTANNTALLLNYIKYPGSVPGITGDVYADMWVNPGSVVTKSFAVNGYDLFGGSSKRIFVIEFTIDNKIRAYSGSSSSSTVAGTWTANQWVRISVKVDFAAEKYKVAVDGVVYATDLNFRDTYTPTASGTRAAGVKEFHSLRFNHVTDTDVSTTDVSIDDIYVGTTPIQGITFGGSSTTRTITVTQPAFGSIALNPPTGPYSLNQSVTATLSVPQGYKNNGWTGDLSGTALVQNFIVTGNMVFSANVGIDSSNPPPKYKITVIPPANGSITLSPSSADSMYYKETPITATVNNEACYLFNGWTGDLSGTQPSKSFTVQSDMTIGADIILNNVPAIKRVVSTVTEFKNALAAMNPGDTVEVNNGSYNLSSLTITRSGCEMKPIIISAKNQGQAILNGATALTLRNLKHVTIKGFSFQSASIGTGIKMENCNRVRITGNSFAYTETASCTWVYIGDTYGSTDSLVSGHNRIDHNTFDGKTEAGNYVRIDGNIDQQSRHDSIDYNWFKNNGPRAVNEKESIRVGVSTLSRSNGFTLIEHNLFEDCDGDPEIISIKSYSDTVRYNTFRRCLGTLSLRQGNGSVAEGNYFFGEGKTDGTNGCGGIRVYGSNHKIINNYFHELTGAKWDAAITITSGDVTSASTSTSSHFQPENITVAFNTLVNNFSNIEVGFDNNGNYNKPPINCTIANNIVVDNRNPIVKSYSAAALSGVTFSNNIMYPSGTSSIGITATPLEINVVDPMLVQPTCDTPVINCNQTSAYKVYRLAETSPAIDAATGNYTYVTTDYEKQERLGLKDIGADEFRGNDPIFSGALDSIHVGPDAVAFDYSYVYSNLFPIKLLNFDAVYSSGKTKLTWQVSDDNNLQQYDVQWSIDGRKFNTIEMVKPLNLLNSNYHWIHASAAVGRNYYRLMMKERDGRFSFSPVRIIHTSVDNTISVYPNPATQQITVKNFGPVSQGAQYKITDAVGIVRKVVLAEASGSQVISLENMPAGLYQIQLVEPGKAASMIGLIIY